MNLAGPADGDLNVKVELAQDRTSLGTRAWLKCPVCSSRRRHLYWLNNQLKCRECHRSIRYYIHTLPAGRFKREVAVPMLKAAGIARRKKMPESSKL